MNRNLATAGIVFLLGLLGLGAGWFFYEKGSGLTSSPANQVQLADLKTELLARNAETQAAQKKKFETLTQALKDDQKTTSARLLAEVEQLARRLSALERDIAARPLPGALAKTRELTAMKDDLETRLTALSRSVQKPRGSAFALLGLSFLQLKNLAATDQPFTTELKILAGLMPANPTLKSLKPYADGTPTRPQLTLEFAQAYAAAHASLEAPPDSFLLQLLYRFVQIRPLNESSGTTTAARLSQLAARMEEGDWTQALILAETLSPLSPQLKDWLTRATRRASLNAHLLQLDRALLVLLAAHATKSKKK